MTSPIRLALVGMGKIARDQHLPAIAANPDFTLAAAVSRHGAAQVGVPLFQNVEALAASGVAVDAVALCTPPQVRLTIAPGATLAEVAALDEQARARGVSLYASWHSRHAAAVEPARAWLAKRTVRRATVTWREDVRHWHPGQDWIFEPGGFGVFDPGINALSIATRILPRALFVERAELDLPVNRDAPIAARVDFRDAAGAPIAMDLDFRQEGPQSWDIVVETDAGTLTLARGGAVLSVDGGEPPPATADLDGEYPALYRRFAELARTGESDVDVAPLRLVADTFLCGRINRVDAFDW